MCKHSLGILDMIPIVSYRIPVGCYIYILLVSYRIPIGSYISTQLVSYRILYDWFPIGCTIDFL